MLLLNLYGPGIYSTNITSEFETCHKHLDKAKTLWRKDKQTRNGKFEAIVPIFLLKK